VFFTSLHGQNVCLKAFMMWFSFSYLQRKALLF